MSNIAAGDVTYSILSQSKDALGNNQNIIQLVFGDGALTYPAGGIPLSKGKMGCPNVVKALIPFGQSAVGYGFRYDYTNEKLFLVRQGASSHAHDILVKGGQAASTTNDIAHYATDILGKEAATDATIAGSASGTKGGVMSASVAAATLAEPSAVAIAAQTAYFLVIGW